MLFAPFLLERDQILRDGGVDGHTTVKVLLGGAHLDGNAKALQHLVRTHAKQVQTHNLRGGDREGRGGEGRGGEGRGRERRGGEGRGGGRESRRGSVSLTIIYRQLLPPAVFAAMVTIPLHHTLGQWQENRESTCPCVWIANSECQPLETGHYSIGQTELVGGLG